ncbi:serine protease 52-like [Sabethes cyaneus]|uniref:serine protease 52-like n=1 Tax=Sabethes cyaneus TaxID=53552 RepID=UPI00237D97DC|nr:serine protease 52-like [Sabethes cyaneus]
MEPMSAIKLGFGDFFERSSPKFEKVTLSFINKTECEERMPLSERSLPNGLLDDQFCAGSDNEDTCEGDSGTPLFVERQDLDGTIIPLVVGIVSFGTLCTDGSTGVYTRVASYKEWIEKEIQSNLSYSACSRNAQSHTKHQTYGNTAANQQLPYHRVEIISNHTDLYAYHCGATMVDYKFAVTSALCAAKIHAPPMYIFVESTKEIIPIDKVYVHPQYSQNKPENDIALLRLTKYLKGEMPLVPACLYRTGETQVLLDKIYYTVRSNQFGNRTRTHTIRMQIKQDNQCNSLINHLNHTMHCGRHQVPLIPSICKVDYGGAISRNVSSPCLYGVVSSLSLGCNSDLFGTKISPYVDWIDHIILNNYSNDLNVSP